MSLIEKPKILIAEDDLEYRDILENLCIDLNFECYLAANGREALHQILLEKFDLFLIDYNMPVVNGAQFVTSLKIKIPDSIVIMLTGVNDSDKIIEIMKLGVFDYLVKPCSLVQIEEAIEKALKFHKTLLFQKEKQLQAAKEIQSKLLWNEYRKNAFDSTTSVTKEILENMRRNLLEGAGLGSQIAMIDVMDLTKKKTETGQFAFDPEFIDLLIANNHHSQKQLNTLTSTLSIISKESLELKNCELSVLYEDVRHSTKRLIPIVRNLKQSEIHIEPHDMSVEILIDRDFLFLAIEELFINACKYCVPNSVINFFTYVKDGYLFLSVKNSIRSEEEGVKPEYEKLVLEPFFRLSKEAEELFWDYEEKYTSGLGLCVVNFIAKKHNGFFNIKNFKDYVSTTSNLCVISEIALPVEKL